jgi:transposase-like protein
VVWVRELSVAEQRYRAVLAVIEDGLSVTEAAAKVGVSRQTLHGWLSRYAEAGLEGLADRSRRLRSCPHQMSAVVESRLVELRMRHPGWGPARAACPASQRLFGEPDYLLRVVTRDLPDFQRVYDDRLSILPGVQRLSSTLVMKTVVENRPLPL